METWHLSCYLDVSLLKQVACAGIESVEKFNNATGREPPPGLHFPCDICCSHRTPLRIPISCTVSRWNRLHREKGLIASGPENHPICVEVP